MTLSMTGYAFTDAFAETEGIQTDETELSTQNDTGEPKELTEANNGSASEETGTGTGENGGQKDEPGQLNEEPETTELPVIEGITATEDSKGAVEITWTAVDGAVSYTVASVLPDASVSETCTDALCRFDKLMRNTAYAFDIKAYDSENNVIAHGIAEITTKAVTFDENDYRPLTDRSVSAAGLGLNLRTLLGESAGGYSVVQGGCTDGTYAYYLMVKTSNQKGKVLKVNLHNSSEVYRSPSAIDICHGNGMAYDSKNHRLVVVGREDRRTELTLIDANSLTYQDHVQVDYSVAAAKGWSINYEGQRAGLAAISYVQKYDCYLALQRHTHDLLVLDQNFKVIGFIFTKITSKYPGTYQAMDADDRYVYLLLSYYNSSQPYNRIIALDWNSENLLDYINGTDKSFARKWDCNNDSANRGKPDADLIVGTPYEAENIFHVTDENGHQTFYLSEYFNNPQYKWVTKKQAYKVKWKKVKKRVKVKWKRVKRKTRSRNTMKLFLFIFFLLSSKWYRIARRPHFHSVFSKSDELALEFK